jgi:hypothetical protein
MARIVHEIAKARMGLQPAATRQVHSTRRDIVDRCAAVVLERRGLLASLRKANVDFRGPASTPMRYFCAEKWPEAQAEPVAGVTRVELTGRGRNHPPQWGSFFCRSELGDGANIQFYIRWGALEAEAMQRYAKELVAVQPTSFSRKAERSLQPCCNKHTPSPSFSRSLAIRSSPASAATISRKSLCNPNGSCLFIHLVSCFTWANRIWR